MKLVVKRSTAATALAEPTEAFASETAMPEPSPAPAGALHRVYPPGHAAAEPATHAAEEPYIPQRGSYGLRLRGGMPRSLAGRILLGSGALLVLGVFALAVAAVRQFLLHDPRFAITSSSAISVEGNAHIPRTDVLRVFGSDLERNIFKVPLAERRADLERLPWVAHATVERLLPNRLRVSLRERTPIAFARQGSYIGLVDAEGVVLDMPPDSAGDPHYSFPVLTGLAPGDSPEMRAARMEVFRRFLADLDSGGQRRSAAVSEVDVTNPEDVKALVTLDGADILVHFGDEQFLQRFTAFQRHLPEWRQQYPRLSSADLRYERQVVLEMDKGTDAAAAPSAASAATAVNAAASSAPSGTGLKPVSVANAPEAHPTTATRAHGSLIPGKHLPAVHLNASEQRARLLALHRAAQGKPSPAERR